MSQTTKRALAASLKKLLEHQTLDKVTVTDLAEDCGVNRQTFYYHFQDIYGLVEWIYTSEAAAALDGKKTYDTWQEGFLHIFRYVQENRAFITKTYHSAGREHLERYLYQETYQLLRGVVEEKAEGLPVREEDKDFLAHFYKYAFAGLILEWIEGGMKADPQTILERLDLVIRGNVGDALERLYHWERGT